MKTLKPQAARRFLTLCFALALGACGGDEAHPPKSAHDVSIEEDADETGPGISMSSEIGGLNQEAVDKVFGKASPDLSRCLNAGAERVELLGGDVKFMVKIGSDGRVQHAHLEESTLGDRDTEQCMLQVLKDRTWPKPIGGETGIAQKPFSFDMPNDVRPATAWDRDSIEETLGELAQDIDGCKSGGGSFTVTMYVDTDGSVMSAGVAHAEDGGETVAECLLTTIKGAQFPSPGSWPAKVTFNL